MANQRHQGRRGGHRTGNCNCRRRQFLVDVRHQDLRADFQTLRDTAAVSPPRPSRHSNWLTEFAAAVHGVVEKAEVHFENEEELVFPLAAQLPDAVTLDRIEAEITALDRRCLQ